MGTSRYPHGGTTSSIVQQLPLGLYAKRCRDQNFRTEPAALRLIEREAPSIPAPRLIDTFYLADGEGSNPKGWWFIMTSVPGVPLNTVLHRMSYPERHRLADDLRDVVSQLQRIPNNTSHLFASAAPGGRIIDHRAAAPGPGRVRALRLRGRLEPAAGRPLLAGSCGGRYRRRIRGHTGPCLRTRTCT
ncbi:hypothetical protein VTK26DRAFT_4008 [Humicola hyalothermophila]